MLGLKCRNYSEMLRARFLRGNWLFSKKNSLIDITDYKTGLMFLKELQNDSKNIIGVQQGCKVSY